VGYSRVHTGVHYPGDVVLGALIGTSVAQGTVWALDRAITHSA
jgi:undecaprenyl-diphosphatase